MRLLTHNVLRSPMKGVVEGYPLRIEATDVQVKSYKACSYLNRCAKPHKVTQQFQPPPPPFSPQGKRPYPDDTPQDMFL